MPKSSDFWTDGQPELAPDLAILSKFSRHGGIARIMVNLANSAARKGYSVDILLASGECPYPEALHPKVRIHAFQTGSVYGGLPALRRYLRRHRPLALLATGERPTLLAAAVTMLAGNARPHQMGFRLAIPPSSHIEARGSLQAKLRRFGVRRLYRRADSIIAVSQGVADDLLGVAPQLAPRLRVLPNPTVTDNLYRLAQVPVNHSWLASGKPPLILGVGRFTPRKDFPTLIRAFEQLRWEHSAHLILLGDGRERRSLSNLCAKLGIAEAVDFPGPCDNPYPYMARANVLAFPSRGGEGSPNVLKESLALGLPVVATDCQSGPREILENGRLGRLVPIGDPNAMAHALAATLAAPPNPARLREGVQRYRDELATAAYLEALDLPVPTEPAPLPSS